MLPSVHVAGAGAETARREKLARLRGKKKGASGSRRISLPGAAATDLTRSLPVRPTSPLPPSEPETPPKSARLSTPRASEPVSPCPPATSPPPPSPPPTGELDDAATGELSDGDLKDLQARWDTASYLLRKPKLDAQALAEASQAASDGIFYIKSITDEAARIGIRRGALSKLLLPYGEETSTLEQAHSSNTAEYEKLEAFGVDRGKATRLVGLANATRALIRVKIADDNDVAQAHEACRELHTFFQALADIARAAGLSDYQVFEHLV
ncbi:hypothetical protein M885DRAFT_510170 [Pelagophyceae sp. CCMP2097]|nr:hypothetical protein M885DRAFT_510170 [Pelagophyceae sp. CCMP2097]|mmetsp:Transcript_22028/g.76304  ORF Transcript_22028/g.76304 Transcript_22028/m.76304 type:complete len:268 (-) Transcript_22028:227-1030(-)